LEEEDLSPVIEKDHADVLVDINKTTVAVEIAMGRNQREIDHVEDRLNQGFDQVITLCRDKGVQDFIDQRVKEIDVGTEQVDIRLIREFLDSENLLQEYF